MVSLISIEDSHEEKYPDATVEDGWEDDECEWSFSSVSKSDALPPPPSPPPSSAAMVLQPDSRTVRLYSTLCEYMDNLHSPSLVQSINECFHNRINTSVAASELVKYYTSRPNLRSYTLETELPRMQYTVYPEDGSPPLTHTEDIRSRYSNNINDDTDLLWRAANQSLLADAISTLTYGLHPPLFRTDLLITALAQKCHFTLTFENNNHNNANAGVHHLTCTCDLVLQFPEIELARVSLHIFFAPSRNVFECQVVSLTPSSTDVITHLTLQRMAEELARDTIDDDDFSHHHQQGEEHQRHFSFRDSLVSASRASEGIKSALDQVDTVVNLQSKWKFLQNVMPSLPSAELLEEVDRMYNSNTDSSNDVGSEEQPQLYNRNDPSSSANTGEGMQLYRREDTDHNHSTNNNINGNISGTGGEGVRELYNIHEGGEEPHTNGAGDGIQLYNREDKDEPQQYHSNNGNTSKKQDGIQLYRKEEEPQQHQLNGTNKTQDSSTEQNQQQQHIVLPSYYEAPPQEEEDISGGWSDDDDDLDLGLQCSPSWTKPEEDLSLEEDYAIKMDSIVDTRKRWIRPIVSLGRIRF